MAVKKKAAKKKATPRKKTAKKKGVSVLSHEMADPSLLKPHPRNYRKHTDDQMQHLIESIREHGFYKNVVVAQDGIILAGHGAVKAATALSISEIPIVRVAIPSDSPQALKILAGDNEIAKLAMQDDRMLVEMLREIQDDAYLGLLGVGYDEKALALLLLATRDVKEVPTTDHAAEWVGLPEFETQEKEYTLVIRFKDPAERDEVVKQLGKTVHRGSEYTWAMRWYVDGKEDPSSLVLD